MLHTEPSFCIYTNTNEDGSLENEKGDLEIKTSQGMDSCEFSFADRSMDLIVESDKLNDAGHEVNDTKDSDQIEPPPSPKMYLATGLGIDVMRDLDSKPTASDEEYYKMMVIEDPCNPLFLNNYAQLLQSKGDLTGAEDYYLRATIQDPKDGDMLMQYAKLVWELHHDHDTALTYFEKATVAAPGDCNILAAYASFLWEIEQAEDENYDRGGTIQVLRG